MDAIYILTFEKGVNKKFRKSDAYVYLRMKISTKYEY